MILHTLNAAPSSPAFNDCLKIARTHDALVLMGDGVYAAIDSAEAYSALLSCGAKLYMLRTDAKVAGISAPGASITAIDMDDLVALTEEFPRQQAWY